MERLAAVQELPVPYGVALRLRDEGIDHRVIAVALGIDDHQLPAFLQIAERKLTNLSLLGGASASTAVEARKEVCEC